MSEWLDPCRQVFDIRRQKRPDLQPRPRLTLSAKGTFARTGRGRRAPFVARLRPPRVGGPRQQERAGWRRKKNSTITRFVKDHLTKLQDAERLSALHDTTLLDTPSEAVFDRAVELATHVLGAPVGLVSFVDDRRQFFKAHVGLSEPVASA